VHAWIYWAASADADREDIIPGHNEAYARRVRDEDLCTPKHLSEEFAAGIPTADLAVLPGGGHFIHVEQEHALPDVVRNFVRHHLRWRSPETSLNREFQP
jgi:pimeloyl-ACP methyl ester carboxylesterase